MTERLETYEIIKHVFGDKYMAVYSDIYKALQIKKHRMIRENNMLFYYTIESKGVCTLSIITTEKGEQALKDMMTGLNALKNAKFKKIHLTIANVQLVQFLKAHDYKLTELKNNRYLLEFK
jgi:hypothetical protein